MPSFDDETREDYRCYLHVHACLPVDMQAADVTAAANSRLAFHLAPVYGIAPPSLLCTSSFFFVFFDFDSNGEGLRFGDGVMQVVYPEVHIVSSSDDLGPLCWSSRFQPPLPF
ncbi:hypothetical protein B0H13DRAFT_2330380 [Mycena leptocephala]|nr:hypothetical protein B0H13DRAFT_2330380 [Mycena leptocephala]